MKKAMYLNLLVLLLSVENLWDKYYFADGESGNADKLREEMKKMLFFLENVNNEDPSFINSSQGGGDFGSIINDLKVWSQEGNNEVFPDFFSRGREWGQLMMTTCFLILKRRALNKTELTTKPGFIYSTDNDTTSHVNYIKWNKHFNSRVIDLLMDKQFFGKISENDSIVLVADIRNSQDLITYSSPSDYKEYIMKIVNKAREIVIENYGIFDRFTGDGFICYFNKYICERFNCDFLINALYACRGIIDYSNEVFQEWVKHIRKLPSNNIGLTIGLDCGEVSFSEVDNHFFAIGTPCVWATRACDAGKAGDIVLNNIVYHKSLQLFNDLRFRTGSSKTKSGELFQVKILDKKWAADNLKTEFRVQQ